MKTALIISGGEYSPVDAGLSYDYAIACDKGVIYAEKMGITPDIIMGDFDSYTGNIPECFNGIEVERHPVMKDDTDTMLAIKHAFNKGYDHIVIACALGGQMDHTIANIQSLAYIAEHGGVGEIVSEKDHIMTLSVGTDFKSKTVSETTGTVNTSVVSDGGLAMLRRREGFSLSLFSLTDKCEGLSIKGAKYNADNITLTNTFPLGHGNSFVDDEVKISIQSGILLIVESRL